MGEMGAVGGNKEDLKKTGIKGEIWEKWGATYGRNGCGGRKHLPESTAGIPWIWIGVGFRMPFARRHSRMGSGYLMSLNDLIGGGTSSPSTRMCHCKKTCR